MINYPEILPGRYVVAVSGGVDSVVLLNLLAKDPLLEIIVAHFDHGIRQNSSTDAEHVKAISDMYGFKYEVRNGVLGSDASEATAREARYEFLESIRNEYDAKAIITAHHQDDLIETSIINILRGTGRHGLTSLQSRKNIIRPLLNVPKQTLLDYADKEGLRWVEDETNSNTKYLRNKIRHGVIPRFEPTHKQQWLEILNKAHTTNQVINKELANLVRRGLHKEQLVLSRKWFVMLPHTVAREVIHLLLNRAGIRDIDRKTIERISVQIKTLPAGKILQAGGVKIYLTKRSARFVTSKSGKQLEKQV